MVRAESSRAFSGDIDMRKKTINRRDLLVPVAAVAAAGALAAAASGEAQASNQPHMDAALTLLQQAKAELQQATHNKGGHRARAIQLIDQATSQVRAGIAAV
jgi:hypothetical protein